MNSLKEIKEIKMYTYKYVPGWLFYNGYYLIKYDDCDICIVDTFKQAQEIVTKLNAAFSEGYIRACIINNISMI